MNGIVYTILLIISTVNYVGTMEYSYSTESTPTKWSDSSVATGYVAIVPNHAWFHFGGPIPQSA